MNQTKMNKTEKLAYAKKLFGYAGYKILTEKRDTYPFQSYVSIDLNTNQICEAVIEYLIKHEIRFYVQVNEKGNIKIVLKEV